MVVLDDLSGEVGEGIVWIGGQVAQGLGRRDVDTCSLLMRFEYNHTADRSCLSSVRQQKFPPDRSSDCLGCGRLRSVCLECFCSVLFFYSIDLAHNTDEGHCKRCSHYMQMQKCLLQLHELFQDFVKSEISKLLLFPYHLFALCPPLSPIRPLALASLPCGHPHCTYRLIGELSPPQRVQKFY